MSPSQQRYHVAIIGSGIAGSTLAAVLARQGLRVVVFEAKSHPRFSIGESMILETSEVMRALAEFYDVPELAYYSSENYLPRIGSSHGVKRHFGFLHHSEGEAQRVDRSLQAVIPKHPHGHELHLYRQDSDAYLAAAAIAYGAEIWQNSPVADVDIADDRVEIQTAGGQTVLADYVVDASGFKSLLAQKHDLRRYDLRTHSRTIFTHMIDVPDYHDVVTSQEEYGLPFSMAEGTLHHIFRGGWLWVIPFNNYAGATNPLCSVGLLLDPRVYPADNSVSPEEEFFAFIERFPSMAAHLRQAKAVRPWTSTGRIQYGATRVVGDRFCLLGHAAGFIDPLFSKGLYSTLGAVFLCAHLLLAAHRDGDYSAQRFAPLETLTLNYVDSADQLVARSYKSFANHKLWVIMSVQWLLGAYTEYLKLLSMRAMLRNRDAYVAELEQLRLVGGGFAEFRALESTVYAVMDAVDPDDEAQVDYAVEQLRQLYHKVDWMPLPFHAILEGKNHLPHAKIRLDTFDPRLGFLRTGAYRDHFFGDHSLLEVGGAFVREALHYSALGVRLHHRSHSPYGRLHAAKNA
jgi:tetracycline 7-halogenase / FADH2 O2-dependent halogenase